MIMWIATVLRNEQETLSDYSIEYATALLMNLSLRAAGKDKCEDPGIELLNVLNDLVEHENL
jgi:LisH domain-containing protein ARMC9